MCTCQTKNKQRQLRANLLAGEARRTTYEGRATLVVPVVMARADTVMNGGVIPPEEMVPYAWNGVPVTVGHPQASDGSPLAVGDPQVLTNWGVGRIFGAVVNNGVLKAEAWLDIARADRVYPGLIKALEVGEHIDVSTGYFCTPVEAKGNIGGREYTEIHRDLRPEHLALLPDEEGACNWADGCGVRSNIRERVTMKLNDAVAALTKALDGMKVALRTNSKKGNARGSDDDRRQIMADLISSDDSPFTPDDEDMLRMARGEHLNAWRDQYLTKQADDPEPEKKDEPAGDAGDTADDTKDKAENMKLNAAEVAKLVKDAVAEAVKGLKVNAALSDDDKAALADAKKARENRKADLVTKVVANTRITKEAAEAMDFATLETVANGILPMPYYGGLGAPVTNADDDDAEVKAMSEFNGDAALTKALNARRGAKAA